ncbi:hypothetical protein D3C85_1489410 [compost metagenome]
MQDKIDVQLQRIQVIAPRGVVAHFRHRAVVLACPQHQCLQRGGLLGVLREHQFDVIIGAQADEARKLWSAQGDATHARRQVNHPQHFQATAFDFMHDAVNGLAHFSHSACS